MARGTTTELAVEMGCYKNLRVVPLACAPSTDARRSDARFRVQGTMQQEGSDLVLAVSLTDLCDGSQVWGERFGSDLADTGLLGFQHETAQAIAARIADEQGILQLTLARESRRNPPARPTTHDAILRAYHADRVQTPEAFVEARRALEAAVAAEPECGIATAILARIYATPQVHAGQTPSRKGPCHTAFTCADWRAPSEGAPRPGGTGGRMRCTSRLVLLLSVCLLLTFALALPGRVAADGVPPSPVAADADTADEYSKEELADLVGQIALYPDVMISSLLPATNYPLDVVQAARYLEKHEGTVEEVPKA